MDLKIFMSQHAVGLANRQLRRMVCSPWARFSINVASGHRKSLTSEYGDLNNINVIEKDFAQKNENFITIRCVACGEGGNDYNYHANYFDQKR